MDEVIDVQRLLAALRIPATKRGKKFWAPCPFPEHEEKTPSWFMRNDPESDFHATHHCFGCKQGGNALTLVMELLKMDNYDARQWLKKMPEIEREFVTHTKVVVLSSWKRELALPWGVQFVPLKDWPAMARKYLDKRRVPEWQFDRWRFGFAVAGDLVGRLVIPVYDAQKRLVSYSARTFLPGREKYMTPHSSDGFTNTAIFGEEYWPEVAARKSASVVVTEGCFTGMAVERALGRVPIAGLLGSQMSPAQLVKLSTFGLVVVGTDPDKAGDQAAEELIGALGRHTSCVRVRPPVGHDFDSLSDDDTVRKLFAAWPDVRPA